MTDAERLLSYLHREFDAERGLVVEAGVHDPANYARHELQFVLVPAGADALAWYPKIRAGGVLAGIGPPPMLPGVAKQAAVWVKIIPDDDV